MISHLKSFSVLGLLLLPFCSLAATSSEIQALQFSAQLETRLNSDIERIIGKNLHVLSVQSEFIQKKAAVANPAQAAPAPTPVVEDIPQLPGLSGVPAQKAKPATDKATKPEQAASAQQTGSTEISKIVATLLLDQSVSTENEQLIKSLLMKKISYNPLRGDQLEIKRISFSETASEADESAQIMSFVKKNLWAIIAVALLIFFVILFMLLRSKAKNKAQEAKEAVPVIDKLKPEQLISQQAYENESIRKDLVKFSLGEPRKVDVIIRKLSLNEQNMPLLSGVYQEFGRSMFTSMYPSLTAQIPSFIHYLEENPLDKAQVAEYVKAFTQLLVESNPAEDAERKNQPFKFLESLSINQLRWLLEDEAERIQAMVVSQLPTNQSTELLETFTTEEQTRMVIEIAQLETLPLTAFNDVAAALAVKAQSIPDFRTLPTDGPQVLTGILDSLPIGKQNELLEQLKETSPAAYISLRENYYVFEDLLRTPKLVISNHIRNLPAQTVAKALADLGEDVVKGLISECPKRYIDMVTNEINILGDLDEQERNQAKFEVVQIMRQAIEEKKLKMTDLESA